MTASASSIDMIGRLVGFNTISAFSNLELIDFVSDYLARHGIDARIEKSADGSKADLIATLGPSVPGGVILSGHTDVVPVEGQSWDTDPFRMVETRGRLYGRGTADMKSFIAIALAMVPDFLAAGLKRPIHLVFSYDEEVGCLGAPALIARYCRDFPEPMAAIIGEPTGMRLVIAHKGVSLFETSVRGRPGHSSDPGAGLNAIAVGAMVIDKLMALAGELEHSPNVDGRFRPGHSSVSIGTIEGGNALNIIAEHCRFVWDCRGITAADRDWLLEKLEAYCRDELLPPLQRDIPEADVSTRIITEVPPLEPEDDNAAQALVRKLTGQNQSGVISFAAEAGMFQDAGIPAVVFGPGHIAQAHQPNEFIDLAQIAECETFFRRLMEELSN